MINKAEILQSLSDKTKSNLRELYSLDEKITDRVLDELIDKTIERVLAEVEQIFLPRDIVNMEDYEFEKLPDDIYYLVPAKKFQKIKRGEK